MSNAELFPISLVTRPPALDYWPVERTSPQMSGIGEDALRLPDFDILTNEQPLTPLSQSFGADRLATFFDDYYNRIYFLPARIDLGAVVSEVRRESGVWNAFFVQQPLNSITVPANSGLRVEGANPPLTFAPLQLRVWEIVAEVEGPASIDGAINYNFANFGILPVPLTGTRAQVSPVRPDWGQQPFRIEYQFRTDIFMSHTGVEQRRALRMTPRKSIQFTSTVTGRERRELNRLMNFWQQRQIVLPEYPRQVEMAQPMAAGSNAAQIVGAAPDWLAPGTPVVLVSREAQETRTVATVGGGFVTFSASGASLFPAGSKIIYAVSGYLDTSIGSRRETTQTAVTRIGLAVRPGSDVTPAPGPAPVEMAGHEVWLRKPNWAEAVTLNYEQDRDEVDYGRGQNRIYTPINFSTRTMRLTYLARDFSEAEEARLFFERMRGQAGEFWMPTFEEDLIPKGIVGAGSTTLRIAGTDILQAYQDDRVNRGVAIFDFDEVPLLRRVVDVFLIEDGDGVDTGIDLDLPHPFPISTSTVRRISWMPRWRHATDTLTIDWLTSTVAQYQLNIRSLESPYEF